MVDRERAAVTKAKGRKIQREGNRRKLAEEVLRDGAETVRALLNAPPDTALLIDNHGTILALNDAATQRLAEVAAQRFGKRPNELIGLCVFDLFPPGLAQSRKARNDEVVRSAKSARFEDERDGKWFDNTIHPIRDRDGKVVRLAIFSRDITETKQAVESLRNQARELTDLNKQLTDTASHLAVSQATLVQLNDQIHKERAAVEELNRSLEARVRERTDDLRVANEELRQRNLQLMNARAQAATDALTGLPNHRAFHERIRRETTDGDEDGGSVGLVMLDIDCFKRVNDSLGHLAGDQILRELARTLTGVVNSEDAFRYGGDEFAILLQRVDRPKATRIAERLRRAVEGRTYANGHKITVSLGVALLSDITGPAEELIYRADMAMYWAKSAGKNRVGDWERLLNGRSVESEPWYVSDPGVRAPDVVAALTAALAAKDPITSAHTERCSWYAERLAEELGLADEHRSVVRLASLLHDIGKLAVPDSVLAKPGPLDEDEWDQMREHPTAALRILGRIRAMGDATPAILHHHEHFDGSGYPDGLTGAQIPITSRILLVTDAFDAMTTDRPYRKAMPVEVAIEELERNSGSQFDPDVVRAFLSVLDRHGPEPISGTATPAQAAASVETGISGAETLA